MKKLRLIFLAVLLINISYAQDIAQKKDSYGIMYEGKWIVKPKFEAITRLSEKGANVSCFAIKADGKYDLYYMVKDQELGRKWKDLEFPFDEIELITEQIARTRVGQKFGLIQVDNWKSDQLRPSKEVLEANCSGIELWSSRVGETEKRTHSAVWFKIQGKEGLVLNIGDSNVPKYRIVVAGADRIQRFKPNKDLLAIKMDGKVGLFDLYRNQKYVFPPKYESFKQVDIAGDKNPDKEGGYFLVEEYNKYGFSYINVEAEKNLLEMVYDSIVQIGNSSFFKLVKDDKVGLSNLITEDKSFKELCRVGYDSLDLMSFDASEDKNEFYISLQFDGLKGFARVSAEAGGVFELLSIPEFDEIHSFRNSSNGGLSYVVGKNGSYGYRYFLPDGSKWEVELQYPEIISTEHNGEEFFFCFRKNKMEINPHQRGSSMFLTPYKELAHEALKYHDELNGLVSNYYRIDFYNSQKRTFQPIKDYQIKADSESYSIDTGIEKALLDSIVSSTNSFVLLGAKKIPMSKLMISLPIGPRFKNNLVSSEEGLYRLNEWSAIEKEIALASYYHSSDTLNKRTFGAFVDTYTFEDGKKLMNRKEVSGDKKKELKVRISYNELGAIEELNENFNLNEERTTKFDYDSLNLLSIKLSVKSGDSKQFNGAGVWTFDWDSTAQIEKIFYYENTGMKLKTKLETVPVQRYTLKRDGNGKLNGFSCENQDQEPCAYGSDFSIIRDENGRFESLVIKENEESPSRRVSDIHVIEALPIGYFIVPKLLKAHQF